MWQPDGWAGKRIGVLTPHADVGPEAEFGAMAPDGISIHAARVPFGAYTPGGAMDRTIANDPVRAFADPPLVDDAAELLPRWLHHPRFEVQGHRLGRRNSPEARSACR